MSPGQKRMSVEHERLTSIIEYAQQSAKMSARIPAAVAEHKNFVLFEHQAQNLLGVDFNVDGDSDRETWLRIERLHETRPPQPENPLLLPWMEGAQGPDREPALRASALPQAIRGAENRAKISTSSVSDAATEPMPLYKYPRGAAVRDAHETYISAVWKPWAEEEKRRRQTIQLYSQLFTLRQQFEGSLIDQPLELVWGVGLGVWHCTDQTVQYPLITHAVEITLDSKTAALEINPRDVETRVESDWYASVDNAGVGALEKEAKTFFSSSTTTFSPFDRGTFEPLLRTAKTHLDPNGVYWPDRVPPGDRSVPAPAEELRVTDTWVLFARPRMNNLFVRDLERFKEILSNGEIAVPKAVNAVVTAPSDEIPDVIFPNFRGLSGMGGAGDSAGAEDLYFPKPFNDEQVRVLQLLETSDGVVVQGPPGTGKTHTIANIICHYLANGKRVLVTSMKEPALGVLREALPREIQSLAISLLATERDGMKQFEHAIERIASQVQSLDRIATKREIAHLQEAIDGIHGTLASIDREIAVWATANLEKITVGGQSFSAFDAARLVTNAKDTYEWLPDAITLRPEHDPKFDDSDIANLRNAKDTLGEDLCYLGVPLPEIDAFPPPAVVLETHRDLQRLAALEAEIDRGAVLNVANEDGFISRAEALQLQISEYRKTHGQMDEAPWVRPLRDKLASGSADATAMQVLTQLGKELKLAVAVKSRLLARPVSLPPTATEGTDLDEPIDNLCNGSRPFGALGMFAKTELKQSLKSIRIEGVPPNSPADWHHVREHIGTQRKLRQLGIRWNALASDLGLQRISGAPDGAVAARLYDVVQIAETSVATERTIVGNAKSLIPTSQVARNGAVDASSLEEVEKTLLHHVAKCRLGNVWAAKQRMLQTLNGKGGPISDAIRDFISSVLGSPTVVEAEAQNQWSKLMEQLGRIHSVRSLLVTVADVTDRISQSGALQWAAALRRYAEGNGQRLLPSDWRTAWTYRRIATYLAAIDQQKRLDELSAQRKQSESQLAKSYCDIVVKRTWLQLAEKASPRIRTALQAYLNAVQKIGKGTGKRAVRYRQDARHAAAEANPAVPCWIMPHFRVSETIPPEFGCFDLVIIDEASQSDLAALPSLLRAEKILIVGDDKQVSPEGIGLEEEKVKSLMARFLANQLPNVRAQLSPERSMYDLFKVVFASSTVMLKEHFRCVAPIIEYSKREFYDHQLRPLRRPKRSERIDPPLVDVFVEAGYRNNADVNTPEARFIVEEIKRLTADEAFRTKTIGVVSLLADKQALWIWQKLTEELGPEVIERHRIACGDARTFQGKERHIIFLSMVCAPNEGRIAPLVRDTFAHRFNVAASRAQDRMYLVRSVQIEDLSEADRLRRNLIGHFSSPFMRDEVRSNSLREHCESPFEVDVFDFLAERGFAVTPQVQVGQFRIDLVVEGANDARLAIECDGDKHHGPEKWQDDMNRQRTLERAGWTFWRCFASAWVRRRDELGRQLVESLAGLGIEPLANGEVQVTSLHAEHRTIRRDSAGTGAAIGDTAAAAAPA
jgi:very-short-patch-repair endonuclease